MLRVWDISQLPWKVEGGYLNPGMRNQESGQAGGPFREPRDSKPLGSEKCHLLKEAGRRREGEGQNVGRKTGPCSAPGGMLPDCPQVIVWR